MERPGHGGGLSGGMRRPLPLPLRILPERGKGLPGSTGTSGCGEKAQASAERAAALWPRQRPHCSSLVVSLFGASCCRGAKGREPIFAKGFCDTSAVIFLFVTVSVRSSRSQPLGSNRKIQGGWLVVPAGLAPRWCSSP